MGVLILLGQSSGASPAPDLRLTRHGKLPFDPLDVVCAPSPGRLNLHKSARVVDLCRESPAALRMENLTARQYIGSRTSR